MRSGDLYVIEAYISNCKIDLPIDGELLLVLRIGRNMASSQQNRVAQNGIIRLNTVIQLNCDASALETQRCSLTLSSVNNKNKSVIGIVLISIPKDKTEISKKFRITQCLDKHAEIEIQLRIIPLDQVFPSGLKNSSVATPQSSISKSSLLQMGDFEKKPMNPPQMFATMASNLAIASKQSKLHPNAENSNFLIKTSIPHSNIGEEIPYTYKQFKSQEEQTRLQDQKLKILQNQCNCYKQLLKVETKKNQAALNFIKNVLNNISKFQQAGKKSEINNKNIDKSSSKIQNLNERKSNQVISSQYLKSLPHSGEGAISSAKSIEKNVKTIMTDSKREQEAKSSKIDNKQQKDMKNIVLQPRYVRKGQDIENPKSLGKSENKTPYSTTNENFQKEKQELLIKIIQLQRNNSEISMRIEKLKSQFQIIEQQLNLKEQEFERYKRRMRLDVKFHLNPQVKRQKHLESPHNLKILLQKSIHERKQLYKLLQRYLKIQNEAKRKDENDEIIIKTIRQQVQKSYNILLGKRITKDAVINQKMEMNKFFQGYLHERNK